MFTDSQAAPALTAISAGEDFARGAGQHGLGAVDHDRRVVDVGIAEPASHPRPALAAVAAAPNPVDLNTSPDDAVVRGVHGQCRHPGYPHIGAFFGHLG